MKSRTTYSSLAIAMCLCLSALVLTGWAWDITAFKSVIPAYITMKANTAFAFLLLSLAASTRRFENRRLSLLRNTLCLVVAALGFATLFEYLQGVDLGIDQFLFLDTEGSSGKFPPGRLAPITAVNLIFLSLSIGLNPRKSRTTILGILLLTTLVLFSSFQALVGYLIGLTYLFGSAYYTQMALHTTVCFILLSTARLSQISDQGFLRNLSNKSPATRMARWMLVSAIFIPPLMKFFSHMGMKHNLYDSDFAQLIQVVGITGLMSLLIVITSQNLFKTEEERFIKQIALADSEEKFRSLVDATAQIIWTADAQGKVKDDSPSWRMFTGQTYEEWLDNGRSATIHPEDREAAYAAWAQSIHSGDTFSAEYRIKHRSGDWRWTLARATPLRNEDGSVRAWTGMNSDIDDKKVTELKLKSVMEEAVRAREEAVQARMEAEKANELKSAFLANMSHEIRTPIGAMLGFADLIRDPDLTPQERADYLDIITRNGEDLTVIINDILDLSKVEAGHINMSFTPLRSKEVCQEVVALYSAKAREKSLDLTLILNNDLPQEIVSDPVRMKQILGNILGNAIKFTHHGRITMGLSAWRENGVDRGLEITVQDTGVGIPEALKEKVFEAFVQGDSYMTRRFGGTGLGLTLSRKLANALGGDVRILSSKVGDGTTFVIRIQNNRQAIAFSNTTVEKSREAKAPTTPKAPLEGMHILVIDDAPDNQLLINRHLKRLGASTEQAENGLIGYEKALAYEYDLILMDIQMAVMDGYTATRKLRQSGFHKPIIAITAHAMIESKARCLEAGCTDYLAKPLNFTDLSALITQYAKAKKRLPSSG